MPRHTFVTFKDLALQGTTFKASPRPRAAPGPPHSGTCGVSNGALLMYLRPPGCLNIGGILNQVLGTRVKHCTSMDNRWTLVRVRVRVGHLSASSTVAGPLGRVYIDR